MALYKYKKFVVEVDHTEFDHGISPLIENPAHWPGFLVFGFFGSGNATGGGLCRATFFNAASK